MHNIKNTALNFVREPLIQPFGFKGGYLSELWQVICQVEDEFGNKGIGLGVQSVLWSDAQAFCSHSQAGGNALMFAVTEYALKCIKCHPFTTPPDMLLSVFDKVYAYAKEITGQAELRKTFVLNAMVPVDFALWQLFAVQQGVQDFETLTQDFTKTFTKRQNRLGAIPLITYGTQEEEILALADKGTFLFKIKIGSNPDGLGNLDAMLAWDKQRLTQIHSLLSERTTSHTDSGRLLYYLDANGRYDTKARLMDFLDYAKEIGALDRIVLLEEPFAENNLQDVHNIPVRIVGDESAHCAEDAVKLIDELGYGAIALKPIAKTLSATLEILKCTQERNVPCFCADLTVNPLMVDWNLNLSSRIDPLPGLKIGVVESNGAQNYSNWEKMKLLHPLPGAPWIEPHLGVYNLDDVFYQNCGVLKYPHEYNRLIT